MSLSLRQAHVVVIGGGYVGQLVQLALPNARLLDWRRTPPSDHLETRMIGPQYLWEPIPGVESYAFPVETLVDGLPPTDAAILAYKRKIGKDNDGGDWELQFQHQTQGWFSKLPVPRVEYNRQVRAVDLSNHRLLMAADVVIEYDVLISTIPLDAFLRMCVISPPVHYPWKQDKIYVVTETSAGSYAGMQLNYLSDPNNRFYRSTLTANKVYHETLTPLPDDGAKQLPVGKIHSHPQSEDVLKALKVFDTYCFGRFATWRPDELAHQTWKHIDLWKEMSL
jgi:hypothetical protein